MSFVIYRTDTTEAVKVNHKVYGIQYFKTKGACTRAVNKLKQQFADLIANEDKYRFSYHPCKSLQIEVESTDPRKRELGYKDKTDQMVELAIADADIYHTKIEKQVEVKYTNKYTGSDEVLTKTMSVNDRGGCTDPSTERYWCM